MRLTCTLIFVRIYLSALGQDIQPTPQDTQSDYDSVRSYYIKQFPNHFFLYPVLKQRSLSFQMEKEKGTSGRIQFKPNNAFSFGIGAYLFEIGVELAFAVPLDQKSIDLYGESKARDIQLNLLGKKWGLDAFYQKYKGFYVVDDNQTIPSDSPYPQRPDIETRNIGLTGSYILNNQRFSFRSSYNFAERQVFSKGSLLLFSSLSNFKLEADSSIIDGTQQVTFGDGLAFEKLRYTSFSIAPGYTYSLVYNNFFLNGMFAIGPAHHWINYRIEGDGSGAETTINSFIAARVSLGYNGPRIFGGITFMSQGSNVKFENTRFTNNNNNFKILIGYRFKEFGVLKKRVWDFVPFRI